MTAPDTQAALERFAGKVAHDLNNLLTAIMGNLELLHMRASRSGAEALLGYIDSASEAATRTGRLAQRLAAYAGRNASPPAPMDLAPLLHTLAEAAPGTLALHLPATLPPVLGDPAMTELAVHELLDNAFTAGGDVTLHADVTATAVTITVRDAGPGMAPDVLAQATTPFFSLWGKGAGKGLGLAIVDAVAQRAGGALVLESAEGAGTTATLTLKKA